MIIFYIHPPDSPTFCTNGLKVGSGVRLMFIEFKPSRSIGLKKFKFFFKLIRFICYIILYLYLNISVI